ncbi:MAG TPA: response regulator transcription factor [Polyangiaceae bacterium]|jgi:DNA-binding response OmpR family regulator
MRALLIDDDRELARLLGEYFSPHDVELEAVETGPLGLERLEARSYDVVLLDVMLPGADGFEICRRIRRKHDIPIVMLTARGDDTDRIVGLELGADDYVPKPFNPRELLARVRAVMRRARPGAVNEKLVVGALELDVPGHRVTVESKDVSLTSFEFRLLVLLARRAGETVPREELASALKGGGYDPSVDRSLDVHVSHLRQKLGDDARESKMIRTVRGVGYVLVRPA